MLEKIAVSKHTEKATPDKVSNGALSRWLEIDGRRLRVVTYTVGYKADHTCYDGHAFYIVEGKIKIHLGDELTEWQAGDAFIIPDEVPHLVENDFDQDAVVVVVDNG